MAQTQTHTAFEEVVDLLTTVERTVGSTELARRAELSESTVRFFRDNGWRPKSMRAVEDLYSAALELKAEIAAR